MTTNDTITTTTVADEHVRVEDVPTGLLIGGSWRPATGGRTIAVQDHSTGAVLA